MNRVITQKQSINGVFGVPGDKSISHRAVMFGAIAEGDTEIEGFLSGEDCLSTIACFREMGVDIRREGDRVTVHGKGLRGLSKPQNVLDVGNSGTSVRLMSGILAAQDFTSVITGDYQIQRRPMDRIITPLRQMGADISGVEDANGRACAPLTIHGGPLKAIEYTMPVASAQVKSAILLAGLYADGETVIHEPQASRDHTERMLSYFGADITVKNKVITCRPVPNLRGGKVVVPGDISSAAYLIAAALIMPDSRVVITNVGVNVTRSGIISAFREMGGHVEVLNRRELCGEWVGDIEVKSSRLTGTILQGGIIPRMIDEIPMFAVAALFAEGRTVIRDAAELKVKESNRIAVMAEELGKLGAYIEETEDGMIIEGGQNLRGAAVKSHDDHRVAMSLAVAGMMASGETVIQDAECAAVSFPDFFEYIDRM